MIRLPSTIRPALAYGALTSAGLVLGHVARPDLAPAGWAGVLASVAAVVASTVGILGAARFLVRIDFPTRSELAEERQSVQKQVQSLIDLQRATLEETRTVTGRMGVVVGRIEGLEAAAFEGSRADLVQVQRLDHVDRQIVQLSTDLGAANHQLDRIVELLGAA